MITDSSILLTLAEQACKGLIPVSTYANAAYPPDLAKMFIDDFNRWQARSDFPTCGKDHTDKPLTLREYGTHLFRPIHYQTWYDEKRAGL